MYTFLFIGHSQIKLTKEMLQDFAQPTKRWMPVLGMALKERYVILPESKSGWFWLAPAAHGDFSLISEVIDEQYALVVFGDIFAHVGKPAAQTVFEAWVSGGAKRVRELEGCFSTVIVNRRTGETVLISDLTGRRRLNYYLTAGTLIVSPHDVTMAATGLVPVEFDLTSVGSVVAMEWSLGGKSLLKNVRSCDPAGYFRWNQEHMERISDPVLISSERIDQHDRRTISENLNHMLLEAQDQARTFIGNRSEIRCDLSAGFDSRVVWSILLSVIDDPSRIISFSVGEAHSLDVRVARRLAAMYKTSFLSYADQSPSFDDFLIRCDLLAFAMNGGTPGKRAMKYPTEFASHPQPYACGSGGEIYRGYYYSNKPFGSQSALSLSDVLTILRKRSRLLKLPWKSPDLKDAVEQRLAASVDTYAQLSANGFDILDLFYLHERMGVWGSATARQTWKNPRWSPFLSNRIIKMAYKMPPPLGRFANFHVETLRRYVPKAYRVRINGHDLLPLDDWKWLSPYFKKLDHTYQRGLILAQKIWNLRRHKEHNRDMDQIAADYLSGTLLNTVREILNANGSFSRQIFGVQGLELLIQEQQSKKKNHIEVLGLLAAMERWRTMVQGAAEEAARAREVASG